MDFSLISWLGWGLSLSSCVNLGLGITVSEFLLDHCCTSLTPRSLFNCGSGEMATLSLLMVGGILLMLGCLLFAALSEPLAFTEALEDYSKNAVNALTSLRSSVSTVPLLNLMSVISSSVIYLLKLIYN